MRFLADESCDFGVVRALREAGHDVRAVVEDLPGATDAEVAADAAVDKLGNRLEGGFAVVEPGRVRVVERK